jgi:lipopolysaccharide assembly outer membrane protein LptD (OstA)
VFVTADDLAEPFFRVRAKHLKLIPGKMIEARNATLYVGKVPVWYLPMYRRYMHRHPNNFSFTPGYRSLFGPYLLGAYNWTISSNLEGTVHFDYRQKRGFGTGFDVAYDLGGAGLGKVESYYAHDQDPKLDPQDRPIEPDRYRIGYSHLAPLRPGLTLKGVVHEQSDPYVIRDFMEGQYRKDTQPKSFLEVSQLWPNFSLDLLAQAQVNDFFQTVERLPDVRLTAVRQQLGVSPFFYEGENSVGYFRFRGADGAQTNYAAFRADTFHQVLLPQTFFGWLQVTPRIGGRVTYYGESENGWPNSMELDRMVFNTGVEVSTKASRLWAGAHSKLLDVNGVRHIVEPSINYAYVPSPNRGPIELPQFDQEFPSLRLLPIDYPDYNSIDAIDSQNTFRFGLRNKVQTKRKGEVENLVNWAVYTDWRLRPRPDQDTFADLYSDMDLKPRSWLTLNSETRLDIRQGQWRMANHTATFEPNQAWSWKVGHRYLRYDPELGEGPGNNLILSSFYYKLNENWGLRCTHHFEARDGTMEEQFYTVYRDLRSWTLAVTLRLRDNRKISDDWSVVFILSLKAFPRFGMGKDRNEPSLLLGDSARSPDIWR